MRKPTFVHSLTLTEEFEKNLQDLVNEYDYTIIGIFKKGLNQAIKEVAIATANNEKITDNEV